MAQVEAFAREQGMEDVEPILKKGALIAQNPRGFESMSELDEADKAVIRRETTRSSLLDHCNFHSVVTVDIHHDIVQINGHSLNLCT